MTEARCQAEQPEPTVPIAVAGVAVTPNQLASFDAGKTWTNAPAFLEAATVVEPSDRSSNVLSFEVLKDGVILLAASWTADGDNSGNWRKGRATVQLLLRDGWVAVASGMYTTLNDKPDPHTVFRRLVKSGESFKLHTRQNGPPLLILPAESRVAEIQSIPPVVELQSNGSPLWTLPFLAGTTSDASTRDFASKATPGSVLVGLRVTTDFAAARFGVCSIQPIYEDNNGRIRGPELGNSGATSIELEAKPGYAIGAVIGSHGRNVTGLKIVFMRRTKTGVDLQDSYESRWVGARRSEAEVKLGGDGRSMSGVNVKAGEAIQFLALVPTPI